MVLLTQMEVYPKEVNWPRHTARLRTARKEHCCAAGCKRPIICGSRCYSVVTWGAGLVGKKFPRYVHPECLKGYIEASA